MNAEHWSILLNTEVLSFEDANRTTASLSLRPCLIYLLSSLRYKPRITLQPMHQFSVRKDK